MNLRPFRAGLFGRKNRIVPSIDSTRPPAGQRGLGQSTEIPGHRYERTGLGKGAKAGLYHNLWPLIVPMLAWLDLDFDSKVVQLPAFAPRPVHPLPQRPGHKPAQVRLNRSLDFSFRLGLHSVLCFPPEHLAGSGREPPFCQVASRSAGVLSVFWRPGFATPGSAVQVPCSRRNFLDII